MADLNDRERDILAFTYFQADISIKAISQGTGYREHVVRNAFSRLKSAGLLRVRPFVNPYALGWTEYVCWISFLTTDEEARGRFVNALVNSPFTTYVGEAGGAYDLVIFICTKEISGVTGFFDDQVSSVPGIRIEKSILICKNVAMFPPKYFIPKKIPLGNLSYGPVAKVMTIDSVDHNILRDFAQTDKPSVRILANKLGIPVSTYEYRVKNLRKRGIILALGHLIPGYLDGLIPFVLLVKVANNGKAFRKSFFSFCEKHRDVSMLIETIGAWEYQIGIHLKDARELKKVVQRIKVEFENSVSSIISFSIGNSFKLSPYPFI